MADRRDNAYPAMTIDEAAYIRRLTLQALATRGVEATFAADGATVRCSDGSGYGLDNLMRSCRNAAQQDWPKVVDKHFADMLSSRDRPGVDDMDSSELLARVRARVLSTEQVEESPGGMLSYGWPIADGLTEVLCVDHPDVVAYLNTEQVSTRDVAALRAAGRRNTADEPIEQVITRDADEARYFILTGESVFVGSKILDVGALVPDYLPAAPHGVIVGAPSRNLLMAHPIAAAESLITAINGMAQLCRTLSAGNPGPISGDLYYWNGDLQRVTSVNPQTGAIAVLVDGAFGDVFTALTR
ncbi:hypothetical protein [Mycobacterium sp. URHD0025]|uniref:hypothetical protein n=1 Tax=Mycobacterium sp. URHD0025 TaxID=1298864 RepID=UPI00042632E0|nr:hypothetical protein [Mycobacterium sp. URHD0025]